MKYSELKQEINKLKEPNLWVKQTPKKGDHIRKRDGLFYHHAIYISDSEIIHMTYGKDGIMGHNGFLEITDINSFSFKRPIEVRKYDSEELKILLPIEQSINRARKSLGKIKYDVLFSNCEHYINFFKLGKFISSQVLHLTDKPIFKTNEIGINRFLNNIYQELNKLKEYQNGK
jgi:hypothetical protein